MNSMLWQMNADGTITIPHSLRMLDTPLFVRAAIEHNDQVIARHAEANL